MRSLKPAPWWVLAAGLYLLIVPMALIVAAVLDPSNRVQP